MPAFGSAFYPLLEVNTLRALVGNLRISSAFGSAFYPLFNPQIRMSADPHFTRSHWFGRLSPIIFKSISLCN